MLERDRHAAARILWVEACMLTPDQDSGSLRTIRLLQFWWVWAARSPVANNMDGADPYRSQIEAEGVEVIHAPFFNLLVSICNSTAGNMTSSRCVVITLPFSTFERCGR